MLIGYPAVVRTTLGRVGGLVRRYRIDRRLPPVVRELLTTVARLRRERLVARRAAAARPVVRTSESLQQPWNVARLDRQRVETAGPLDVPLTTLAHRHATMVVHVLTEAGCEPFLVARKDHGLQFGLSLEDRRRAIESLANGMNGPGWLLEWADGNRSGLIALRDAVASRRVQRARTWRIFEARSWGEMAVGLEQAVELGFWSPGSSGQLELVGTRGQARFDERSEALEQFIDGVAYPGRSAFPVQFGLEHMTEPIDLVYTWVDGGDLLWQDSFRRSAHAAGRALDDTALDAARYEIRDELRYSLRSVWAHCGWVRNIYIVTAGQVPPWFVGDDRVRIVDHSEIFPPEALPTFNSHAIEASLHKIEGLAEHFIYFNDDMFVARALRPETFFTSNGLARVFQSDARVPAVEDPDTLAVDTAARRGRELLNERFGRVVAHKPLHSPYPLRLSALEQAAAEFADAFERTVHSRFRSPTDLSVAASFGQHYGVATGSSVFGEISSEYVHVESGRLAWHLDRILLSDDLDTFCINATRSGTPGQAKRDALIADFLQESYPLPSPWERV